MSGTNGSSALWHKVPTPAAAAKVTREGGCAHPQGPSHPPSRRRDRAANLAQDGSVRCARHDGGCLRAYPQPCRRACVWSISRSRRPATPLDSLCAKLGAPDEESPSGQSHEQCDVTILRSWPGIGRIVLATLLTEAAQSLCKPRDYHALRALAGVAPVTRRSGKKRLVSPPSRLQQAAADRRLSLVARRHPA